MQAMTGKERVAATLSRQPVDHVPFYEDLWGETVKRWTDEGHVKQNEDLCTHFKMDLRTGGWFNSVANLDFQQQVIEETEDTILALDGNGTKLRRHKKHSATPEHVDFTVRDKDSWEKHIRPFLVGQLDKRRINFEAYKYSMSLAKQEQQFFCWAGIMPFEQMHPVCGHEHMLAGMALEPEWIVDMVDVYANLTINCFEELFAAEGKPDGIFFYEDMGFKERPFMSPAMYEELIMPGHKRLCDYAHSIGCKVIIHSCGFVEPLVPGMIRAGMDCLQAMEVKAGMDMPRLFEKYGQQISFFGNIDVRELISNDHKRIDAELLRKISPVMKGRGGYILHSDHSIPPEVDYDTLCYFRDRGQEIGKNS